MQLNYFPINIEFEKYQISTEPYTEERLAELRKLYNSTHSFFRNDGSIYISNKDGDENIPLGTLTEKSTYGNHEVTASLIKHLFFRTFNDRFADYNYTPVDFYPFRFLSKRKDIISKSLPNCLQNKIAYKKLIEVQLRLTQIGGVKRFGFVVSIRHNWIFEKSCAELHSEGYDLKGIDVLLSGSLPGLQSILAPNEEFIGVIQEVSGTKAKVETNEGVREYSLEELFIKKTKFNIGNYLTFATSQQECAKVLKIVESKRSEIYNAKNLYNEIQKIAERLFVDNGLPVLFQNKDSFCFTVNSKPLAVTNTIELKTPDFIFNYAATRINKTNPDTGLTDYGPYDSINFDIKSPKVLCICNKTNRGYFSSFLSNLKDGMPASKYFKKGLLKKYDLQDVVFDIKEIQSNNASDYLNTIKNYDDDNKPHLALIEIPAFFRECGDKTNPYYRIKAKLLSLEIPVQYITCENVKNHNQYILNSIALQIYAKLGGTPWVLPSQRSVDREIIIGIGHNWLRRNPYKGAEQSRVVGITTFLESDGQYLLGDKVKDVPFENYFDELLKSLKRSIKRLATEQGWTKGDTIRLIFHIFKPIKNTEFDVISQLIKETPEYKIKFAFVTISKTHPYLLFDPEQIGVSKYDGTIKGEFIPNRASNIFLDSETCIVQMFGAKELKTEKHGMSTPIQIKIRTPQGKYGNNELNDLLYYDLSYITQQIFSFTYLSWRNFLPGEIPATMLYSNLISKLLGKMRDVPGWDSDKLNYSLKRKKWFL